jgi:hypothetical protein
MTSEALSELADEQLVRVLASRGRRITVRQARRWREEGHLPAPDRRGLGRAGSFARYGERAIEHADALALLRESGRSLDEATAVLFLRGFEPRERALRNAYRTLLIDPLQREGFNLEAADPWRQVESAARTLSRRAARQPAVARARERLSRSGERASLIDVLTNLLAALLGAASMRGETALALGVEPVTAEELQPYADDLSPAAVARTVQGITLPALTDTIDNAPLDALRQARTDLTLMNRFATAFSSAAIRASGFDLGIGGMLDAVQAELQQALAIPAVCLARKAGGPEYSVSLAAAEQMLPSLDALNRLLNELPARWQSYLGPAGALKLAQTPEPERSQLLETIKTWAEQHPDDTRLIGQLEQNPQ